MWQDYSKNKIGISGDVTALDTQVKFKSFPELQGWLSNSGSSRGHWLDSQNTHGLQLQFQKTHCPLLALKGVRQAHGAQTYM